MNTDRNLLFGVLAMQLELINLNQFGEVCAMWATRKTSSLGEILLELHWLTRAEFDEVERLIVRTLRRHQGDVRRALADTADVEVRNAIRDVDDPLTQHTVDLLPPAPYFVQFGMVDNGSLPMDRRSRYSLTKVQGQGGLGRVWLARDLSLQRAVALKEPRSKADLSPEDWRRFVVEAQVTGQLEHPNIIPVYELVHEPESRDVFYTMRFVRGQTLSGALADYHERAGKTREDSLELRKFLSAFISICHALAYAHSRGVVHCDLKPANIMLGAFGEVIVLDWGLAKIIALGVDAEAAQVQISDDVRPDQTKAGGVRGTLTYMSPEQAEGRPDHIDSRTDIYGLGATLFAILTNNQPHRPTKTENSDQLIQRILHQPTPLAREVLPSVPPALEAICAKAMARKRSERYSTALELAQDIERWLADQEVSVYRDPWTTRQLRWMRRNRSWTVSIATSMLVITLMAMLAAIVVDAARRSETAALAQTKAALFAEQQAKQREADAKQEALRRFRQSQRTVDTMLTGVGDVLQFYPGAKSLRTRLLEEAAQSYAEFAAENAGDPALRLESARAYVRLGDVRALLGEHAAARKSHQSALRALKSLSGSGMESEAALDRALCLVKLGQVEAEIGATATAGGAYDQAQAILAELPGSPSVDHARGTVLLYRGQLLHAQNPLQARDQLLAAEKILSELTGAATRGAEDGEEHRRHVASLALCRSVLGQTLASRGETAAAVEVLARAVDAFRELTRLDPDYPPYLDGLAFSEVNLANALRTLPRHTDQAQALDRAIDDFATLAEAVPGAPRFRENRAIARTNRAWLMHERGENEAARQLLDAAIGELNELYRSPARVPRFLEEMAVAAVVLGQVLTDLEQNESAEINLQNAISAYQTSLLAQEPTSARYERGLGAARRHLGRLFQNLERLDDAEREYSVAVERLNSALARVEEPFARDELALAHEHLGDLCRESDRGQQAEEHYETARRARLTLPADAEYRCKLATLLAKFSAQERKQEALAAARKLAEEFPRADKYQVLLGAALFQTNDCDGCIATLTELDETIAAKNCPRHFWLTLAYKTRGKEGDEELAAGALARAEKRMQDHAPGCCELRALLRQVTQTKSLPRDD